MEDSIFNLDEINNDERIVIIDGMLKTHKKELKANQDKLQKGGLSEEKKVKLHSDNKKLDELIQDAIKRRAETVEFIKEEMKKGPNPF